MRKRLISQPSSAQGTSPREGHPSQDRDLSREGTPSGGTPLRRGHPLKRESPLSGGDTTPSGRPPLSRGTPFLLQEAQPAPTNELSRPPLTSSRCLPPAVPQPPAAAAASPPRPRWAPGARAGCSEERGGGGGPARSVSRPRVLPGLVVRGPHAPAGRTRAAAYKSQHAARLASAHGWRSGRCRRLSATGGGKGRRGRGNAGSRRLPFPLKKNCRTRCSLCSVILETLNGLGIVALARGFI